MFRFWKKKPAQTKIRKGQERRREPRLEDMNALTIEPRQPEKLGVQQGSYLAKTKNASASGLMVECEIRFPLNTPLSIKFESQKTGKTIQAEGIVRWATRIEEGDVFEMGVEFTNTPIRTIMDFLEHIYKA
jgi:hypothetical protein